MEDLKKAVDGSTHCNTMQKEAVNMTQKLILPINKCRITASYKTTAYSQRFGFIHYGVDMISSVGNSTLYASGNGTVIKTGVDSCFGNIVVVRYDDVYNHKTGQVQSVICRYYHLASIAPSLEGATINKDTRLGCYGNTGKYSAGAHLHIEFDSNLESPLSTKTLGKSSDIMRASTTDTTIDPMALLYCKVSEPDCQTISADISTFNRMPYADPSINHLPRVM